MSDSKEVSQNHSIKSACHAVKARGTVVNVAIWEKEVSFNPNWLTWKESTFKSVLGYQRQDFQAVIEHLKTGRRVRTESYKCNYD